MTDSEFVTVYAEYVYVVAQDTAKVQLRDKYLRQILSEQGKTVEEFRNTWNALNDNPLKWAEIIQAATIKLREKMNDVDEDKIEKFSRPE